MLTCWKPHDERSVRRQTEDLLDIDQRPCNPAHAVVCPGETRKQLVAATRVRISSRRGRVPCEDDEDERWGRAMSDRDPGDAAVKCIDDVPDAASPRE